MYRGWNVGQTEVEKMLEKQESLSLRTLGYHARKLHLVNGAEASCHVP